MMNEKVKITFDEDNKVRVLDPEHFKQTAELAEQCSTFVESALPPRPSRVRRASPLTTRPSPAGAEIREFNEGAQGLIGILEAQAERIEKVKAKVRAARLSALCHARMSLRLGSRPVLEARTRALIGIFAGTRRVQAIGQRNRLEAEPVARRRKQYQLQQQIHERLAELDRCADAPRGCEGRSQGRQRRRGRLLGGISHCVTSPLPPRRLTRQYESLEKVEKQQAALIEKLGLNEV